MDDKKAQNGRSNGGKWNPALVAIVSAIVGSGSGVALVFNTPFGAQLARPNPYTSIQAEARHKQTDTRLMNLEGHVLNHPDDKLRAAISVLTANQAALVATQQTIITNQDRIWRKLDSL